MGALTGATTGATTGARRAGEITVVLPAALRPLFRGLPEQVALSAANISEAIDALDRSWPGLKDRLCEPGPRIRRNINVFLAGRRVGLDTPLAPGNVVTIMTAVIG